MACKMAADADMGLRAHSEDGADDDATHTHAILWTALSFGLYAAISLLVQTCFQTSIQMLDPWGTDATDLPVEEYLMLPLTAHRKLLAAPGVKHRGRGDGGGQGGAHGGGQQEGGEGGGGKGGGGKGGGEGGGNGMAYGGGDGDAAKQGAGELSAAVTELFLRPFHAQDALMLERFGQTQTARGQRIQHANFRRLSRFNTSLLEQVHNGPDGAPDPFVSHLVDRRKAPIMDAGANAGPRRIVQPRRIIRPRQLNGRHHRGHVTMETGVKVQGPVAAIGYSQLKEHDAVPCSHEVTDTSSDEEDGPHPGTDDFDGDSDSQQLSTPRSERSYVSVGVSTGGDGQHRRVEQTGLVVAHSGTTPLGAAALATARRERLELGRVDPLRFVL